MNNHVATLLLLTCTTGCALFAVCLIHTKQIYTANDTRQTAARKVGVCRVLLVGHTAKLLPCALADPRQIFLAGYQADVADHCSMPL